MGSSLSRLEQLVQRSKKRCKLPERLETSKPSKKMQRIRLAPEAIVFNVFHIICHPDSLNTHFLFVDQGHKGGETHHIIGSASRRHYETKKTHRPSEVAPIFTTVTWIGSVQGDRYPRFRELCRSVPPPRREGLVWMYGYQGVAMTSTEQWTEAVISALISNDVLDQ